jgi:hypothetical protein
MSLASMSPGVWKLLEGLCWCQLTHLLTLYRLLPNFPPTKISGWKILGSWASKFDLECSMKGSGELEGLITNVFPKTRLCEHLYKRDVCKYILLWCEFLSPFFSFLLCLVTGCLLGWSVCWLKTVYLSHDPGDEDMIIVYFASFKYKIIILNFLYILHWLYTILHWLYLFLYNTRYRPNNFILFPYTFQKM